jgi:peroxiredoxin Q/BCP
MRRLSLLWIGVLLLGAVVPVHANEPSTLPQVGQAAPDFRLQDQNGKWPSPADHRGRWVVFLSKGFHAWLHDRGLHLP